MGVKYHTVPDNSVIPLFLMIESITVFPNKKQDAGQCLVGSLTGAVASKRVKEAYKGRLESYRNGAHRA